LFQASFAPFPELSSGFSSTLFSFQGTLGHPDRIIMLTQPHGFVNYLFFGNFATFL